MGRFLDAESNGGIFIDITRSERNILICKVIGCIRPIYYKATKMRHATIYIFSKQRRFYLYF